MKHQNIFWGFALIILGTLILLDRLGIFIFEWVMLKHLWPVLLILWGISIIPTKGFIKLGLSLVVAVLAVVIYNQKAPEKRTEWKRIEFKKESSDKDAVSQTFSEPMDKNISKARLQLDAGAGAFKMRKSSPNLIDFDKKRSLMTYDFKVESFEDEAKIFISQNTRIQSGTNRGNDVSFKLNPDPVWEFEFNIGAGSFDFDMSELKVEKLDLNGGAADINLKLGDRQETTRLELDAGASSITVRIPKGAGGELRSSSLLSSRNIPGFERISKGHFRTENFDSAEQKVIIELNTAISSFTVVRY